VSVRKQTKPSNTVIVPVMVTGMPCPLLGVMAFNEGNAYENANAVLLRVSTDTTA